MKEIKKKIPRKLYTSIWENTKENVYKFLEKYQGNFIQAFSRSVSL